MLIENLEATCPADKPRETIDYIFINKTGAANFKRLGSAVVDEPAASDHRPVMVDVKMNK